MGSVNNTCPSDCGQAQQQVFDTLDAGKHWSPITSPCACAPAPDDGAAMGWVGTTLFAIPGNTPSGHSANQQVAKSSDGSAFTWLNLGVQPSELFTTADTVYAINGVDIYKSADLGSSWTKTSPAYNGNPVAPLAMAPGGAMLGIDGRWLNPGPNTYPLLRSGDGGATWQPDPALSSGDQINAGVLETPDGSVYVTEVAQTGQAGIYTLAPGASAWRLISPVAPADLRLISVTWNASGQPLTLWGVSQAHPGTSDETTVLWSHAA